MGFVREGEGEGGEHKRNRGQEIGRKNSSDQSLTVRKRGCAEKGREKKQFKQEKRQEKEERECSDKPAEVRRTKGGGRGGKEAEHSKELVKMESPRKRGSGGMCVGCSKEWARDHVGEGRQAAEKFSGK